MMAQQAYMNAMAQFQQQAGPPLSASPSMTSLNGGGFPAPMPNSQPQFPQQQYPQQFGMYGQPSQFAPQQQRQSSYGAEPVREGRASEEQERPGTVTPPSVVESPQRRTYDAVRRVESPLARSRSPLAE